jgi:hypothetical protein
MIFDDLAAVLMNILCKITPCPQTVDFRSRSEERSFRSVLLITVDKMSHSKRREFSILYVVFSPIRLSVFIERLN